jgi:hypothetical protein
MTFLRGVGRASEIDSSRDVVDGDARPAEVFPNRDRHRGRLVCREQGREDIREEVGGGGEIVRRSVRAPCEHQVVLRCPPRSGDGSLVGGGTECGVQVGNDKAWLVLHSHGRVTPVRSGGPVGDNQAGPGRRLSNSRVGRNRDQSGFRRGGRSPRGLLL